MTIKKHIFIVAGESSGDQHAARYITEHRSLNPDLTFSAIGQNEIINTGADIILNSEKISVVGIVEVISKYRQISSALDTAYEHIKKQDQILSFL